MQCIVCFDPVRQARLPDAKSPRFAPLRPQAVKIHQRGVQWKQGVVVYIILQAVLLYNTTPIHCTPLRLHPPLMNTPAGRPATRPPPPPPNNNNSSNTSSNHNANNAKHTDNTNDTNHTNNTNNNDTNDTNNTNNVCMCMCIYIYIYIYL